MSYLDNKVGLQSLLDQDEDLYIKGGPFDTSNPRSLINIAPEEVVEVLNTKMPVYLLYMTEKELDKAFRPDSTLQKIRIAFWKEYEAAQSEFRKMTINGIGRYLGYGSIPLAKSLKKTESLAVILCPVTSYENFLEEALMTGAKRLREMLELPFITEEGKVDKATLDIVLKAVAFLDLRKNGGIVQRQVSVNMSKSSQESLIKNVSIDEIDAKIKELEEGDGTVREINAIEAEYAGKATRG